MERPLGTTIMGATLIYLPSFSRAFRRGVPTV